MGNNHRPGDQTMLSNARMSQGVWRDLQTLNLLAASLAVPDMNATTDKRPVENRNCLCRGWGQEVERMRQAYLDDEVSGVILTTLD
jgi:hypothetical protein